MFDLLPKQRSSSDLKLCDLPRDLTEEVLSRLPVTSLRGTRLTCKKLNTITTDLSFAKNHIAKTTKKKKEFEFEEVIMMVEYRVYLMRVNLLTPSIEPIGKLISLADADRVDISQIFHCDGLLLCIISPPNVTNNSSRRLVVWNPYLGQTRWIQPRISYNKFDRYALGYDKSQGIHKILRFVDDYDLELKQKICEFEIYSFKTNSWKVLLDDVGFTPPNCFTFHTRLGVSVEGNTYWYAQEKPRPDPPLVRDDDNQQQQLAILFQKRCRREFPLEIWITNKIEPNAVSWKKKKFFAVDMKPLKGSVFGRFGASFFVDEKKKVAMILDKDIKTNYPNVAYIIGKKGYFKRVDLGESGNTVSYPLVCSYTPTSVQIS